MLSPKGEGSVQGCKVLSLLSGSAGVLWGRKPCCRDGQSWHCHLPKGTGDIHIPTIQPGVLGRSGLKCPGNERWAAVNSSQPILELWEITPGNFWPKLATHEGRGPFSSSFFSSMTFWKSFSGELSYEVLLLNSEKKLGARYTALEMRIFFGLTLDTK